MTALHQIEESDPTDVVGTKFVHNIVNWCATRLGEIMAPNMEKPDLDTSTQPTNPNAQTISDQFRILLRRTIRTSH